MDRDKIKTAIEEFTDNSPTNFMPVRSSDSDREGNNFVKNNVYGNPSNKDLLGVEPDSPYAGMRFYRHPVFSVGRADDPGFETIKRPDVVGAHHKMPEDWLPGAKTVISMFLPYEKSTVEANKADPVEPAMPWLMTRVEGQIHLLALGAMLRDLFIAEGYRAVTPYTEDGFIMQAGPVPLPGTESVPPYSSNWSERHVGVVTGLGTFGLSTNFISKVGCAGRLISVVTDWDTEADPRDYTDWLGYCNRCGACIKKCPPRAHFQDKPGKDHAVCGGHIGKTCAKYTPRYGCGKCQSGIPCEYEPRPLK